jgi:hypothetical protein
MRNTHYYKKIFGGGPNGLMEIGHYNRLQSMVMVNRRSMEAVVFAHLCKLSKINKK